MSKHIYQWALYALLLVFVVSCGGTTNPGDDGGQGGGNGDGNGNNPGNGNGDVGPALQLQASSPQLPSASASPGNDPGSNAVILTALITDANGNPVSNAVADFQVTRGDSVVACSTTAGVLDDENLNDNQVTLYTGCDPAERVIEIRAQGAASSLADTIRIRVVGNNLQLHGPAELRPNDSNVTYTATLTDSAGNGIVNQLVKVTTDGALTQPGALTTQTNAQGEISFTVSAAAQEGSGTITASALNASETVVRNVTVDNQSFQFVAPETNKRTGLPVGSPVTLTVRLENASGPVSGRQLSFVTNRGTLTPTTVQTNSSGEASVTLTSNYVGSTTVIAKADPPSDPDAPAEGPSTDIDLEFIATDPDRMALSANPLVIAPSGSSTITAKITDAHGNPVTGAEVSFSIAGSGGKINPFLADTSASGIATTTYRAVGQTGTNPEIAASVGNSSAQINQAITLTIADNAIEVTVGTNGIVHGGSDGNNPSGDGSSGNTDDGTSGDGDDNPDTGDNADKPGTTEPPESPEYRVHYVANVNGANGQPVDNVSLALVRSDLLAYQEGDKQLQAGSDRWAPDYAAPVNAAGFGCSPTDRPSNVPGSPAQMIGLEKTAPGQWEFNVTYPQNYSGWAVVLLTVKAARTDDPSIKDTARVRLNLAMSDADATDMSSSPPGIVSPYGTDGDCTTSPSP